MRSNPEKSSRAKEVFEEHSIILTSRSATQRRIDSDACQHFVAQVHRQVQSFIKEELHQEDVFFQIAYAIPPEVQSHEMGDRLVLDIQATPLVLTQEQTQRLTDRLTNLRIPRVVEGPVSMVATIPSVASATEIVPPKFQLPFLKYYTRRGPQSLDGIVLKAAGMEWREKRRLVPFFLRHKFDRGMHWWKECRRHIASQTLLRWRNWRRGITTLPERIRQNLGNASISVLSHWLDEYPRSSELLKARGIEMASRHEWLAAVRDFTAYLVLNPDDVNVLCRRGDASCRNNEFGQGLGDFKRALELDPNSFEARLGLASIYIDLSAWDEAEKQLGEAIEQKPMTSQLHLMRSLARGGKDDLLGAKRDLDRCIQLDPNHLEFYARRALLRQQSGPGSRDEEQWLRDIEADLTCHLDLRDDQAAAWAHRAEVRLKLRDFRTALADCAEALKLDPELAWAYGIKAVVHRFRSEWELANDACEKAIDLGLESADVYLSRAMSRQELGQADGAYEDCSSAISVNPSQPGGYELRGVLLLEQGDFDAAISDFTAALQFGAEPARCFVNRGNAHRLNQNVSSAIVDYGRAIEHDPSAVPAYLNRALAFEQEGRFEAAREDTDRALNIDGDSVMALDIRGRLWQEVGQHDRAIEDWSEALANQPDFAPALFNRGQLLMQLQRVDEAEADFSRLATLCPDWPVAHSSRGGALIQQGDMEAAEAAFREAIELDPDAEDSIRQQRLLFEAHYHQVNERYSETVRIASEVLEMDHESCWALRLRAGAYWYNEEYVEAVDDFTRVIESDDESADDYSGRGQALAELGDYDRALSDLDRALEMAEAQPSPQSKAYSLSGKGLALVGLGRYQEAHDVIERSIELCPENAWALYNRGLLEYGQGQKPQAVKSFEEAIRLRQPALTPRKRQRAEAFIRRFSDSDSV
ncbi:MAG: tetratricopeptide repeat protein [Planctomycetota bacterium]|nr:tetratricopeptide repeat protein [Planctomycetota bacterium]